MVALAACARDPGDAAVAGQAAGVSTATLGGSYDPDAPALLAAGWHDWKASWVTTSGAGGGARVMFQEGSNRPGDTTQGTVSEGMGYGMLLAVYFDEPGLFDQLDRYVQAHLDANGLMGWKVLADGTFDASVGGSASATDADEDIAAALLLASTQWSNASYRSEASAFAASILRYDVDSTGGRDQSAPTFSILGGDWNTSAPINFNPSYFAPAWYRLFQSLSGDARWGQVIDAGYAILARGADKATGLVPQGTFIDGTPFSGQNTYEYNAFRTPFRLAQDAAWFGELRASSQVSKIAAFYAGVLNPDHTQLDDPHVYATRALDGTVIGKYEAGGFTATACVALVATGNAGGGRYLWDGLWADGRTSDMAQYYFDGAWHLFGTLFVSGNFPNLAASPSAPPPAPPSFTIQASATPNPVAAGDPTTLSISVQSNGATYPSVLVDVEIYDANLTQVAQTWFTPVDLPSGAAQVFTWNVRAPGTTGTYAIDVGVFSTDWSRNDVYVQAGSLNVVRGP